MNATQETLECKRCHKMGIDAPNRAMVVQTVRCKLCHQDQPASDYFSAADQFRQMTQAALANRRNLAEAQQKGVTCSSCGGNVPFPTDLTLVTFPCRFCGMQLLLSSYVAPEHLMGVGMRNMMAGMREEAKSRDRKIGIFVGIAVALVAVVVLVVALLSKADPGSKRATPGQGGSKNNAAR